MEHAMEGHAGQVQLQHAEQLVTVDPLSVIELQSTLDGEKSSSSSESSTAAVANLSSEPPSVNESLADADADVDSNQLQAESNDRNDSPSAMADDSDTVNHIVSDHTQLEELAFTAELDGSEINSTKPQYDTTTGAGTTAADAQHQLFPSSLEDEINGLQEQLDRRLQQQQQQQEQEQTDDQERQEQELLAAGEQQDKLLLSDEEEQFELQQQQQQQRQQDEQIDELKSAATDQQQQPDYEIVSQHQNHSNQRVEQDEEPQHNGEAQYHNHKSNEQQQQQQQQQQDEQQQQEGTQHQQHNSHNNSNRSNGFTATESLSASTPSPAVVAYVLPAVLFITVPLDVERERLRIKHRAAALIALGIDSSTDPIELAKAAVIAAAATAAAALPRRKSNQLIDRSNDTPPSYDTTTTTSFFASASDKSTAAIIAAAAVAAATAARSATMPTRTIEVHVVKEYRQQKKAFLGGYRHREKHTVHHHAATQTLPRQQQQRPRRHGSSSSNNSSEPVQMVEQMTQTQQFVTVSSQTMREVGTQMNSVKVAGDDNSSSNNDNNSNQYTSGGGYAYIDNSNDTVLYSRPVLVTGDQLQQQRQLLAIDIQCFLRQCFAYRTVKQLRKEQQQAADSEQQAAALHAEQQQQQQQQQLQRRMHPKPQRDFDTLYSELVLWKHAETQRIQHLVNVTPQQQQQQQQLLLEKEIKLLQTIDALKREAKHNAQQQLQQQQLSMMSNSKQWVLSAANNQQSIAVMTPSIEHAATLVAMYNSLQHSGTAAAPTEERLSVLATVSTELSGHASIPGVAELQKLLSRERDLLHRNRNVNSLTALRTRILSLFLLFIQSPMINSEAEAYKNVPSAEFIAQHRRLMLTQGEKRRTTTATAAGNDRNSDTETAASRAATAAGGQPLKPVDGNNSSNFDRYSNKILYGRTKADIQTMT